MLTPSFTLGLLAHAPFVSQHGSTLPHNDDDHDHHHHHGSTLPHNDDRRKLAPMVMIGVLGIKIQQLLNKYIWKWSNKSPANVVFIISITMVNNVGLGCVGRSMPQLGFPPSSTRRSWSGLVFILTQFAIDIYVRILWRRWFWFEDNCVPRRCRPMWRPYLMALAGGSVSASKLSGQSWAPYQGIF